jgi:endonuclease/exonuclease/phosphatase family metal-dependent hydrolase
MGDFNSNSIWDGKHGKRSHSALVERLRTLKFESAYHAYTKEPQGAETRSTIYFRKKQDAPYHIDYAFLSERLLCGLARVEVGTFQDWIAISDHVPVVVDIEPGAFD